jgi:hypothetical protein
MEVRDARYGVNDGTFVNAVCLTMRKPLMWEFCALAQHQSSAGDAPQGFYARRTL